VAGGVCATRPGARGAASWLVFHPGPAMPPLKGPPPHYAGFALCGAGAHAAGAEPHGAAAVAPAPGGEADLAAASCDLRSLLEAAVAAPGGPHSPPNTAAAGPSTGTAAASALTAAAAAAAAAAAPAPPPPIATALSVQGLRAAPGAGVWSVTAALVPLFEEEGADVIAITEALEVLPAPPKATARAGSRRQQGAAQAQARPQRGLEAFRESFTPDLAIAVWRCPPGVGATHAASDDADREVR
jgi:hypothetical protein